MIIDHLNRERDPAEREELLACSDSETEGDSEELKENIARGRKRDTQLLDRRGGVGGRSITILQEGMKQTKGE